MRQKERAHNEKKWGKEQEEVEVSKWNLHFRFEFGTVGHKNIQRHSPKWVLFVVDDGDDDDGGEK